MGLFAKQVDYLTVPIKYFPRVIVAVAIAVLLLFWILENVDQRLVTLTNSGFQWIWFFFALAFSTAIGFTGAGLLETLVVRWTKSRHHHSHRRVLH